MVLLQGVFTAQEENIGHFFHVTDFHLDSNYSQFGDVTHWCHPFANGSSGTDIGKFGNYTCDAPLTLIKSAVEEMKEVLPNPDFIIWTGDSLPHVPESLLSTEGKVILTKFVLCHISIFPCI